MTSPYITLHRVAPSYEQLHMFGSACYPNLSTKAAHKLAPQSSRCIFLGYTTDHKGYRCLNITNNNIVISRHTVFDEVDFSFSASPCLTNDLDIFLHDDSSGVAPMHAPLPVTHAPPGFPPLAMAGNQTVSLGGQITLGTEAGGQTVIPGSQTTPYRGWRSDHHPGRFDHQDLRRSFIACFANFTCPHTSPKTLATPHVALSTPPAPSVALASTTTAAPPVAPEPYSLHYSRHPRATRDPPAPPLHQ
jgi:hypothetical protein